MNLLKDFFKKHNVKDVMKQVNGELNEYSTKYATYFYGNGELIISPADENQCEQCFVVDRIGFDPMLVEI